MCGIAGTINFKNTISQQIFSSLHHRGPDENGLYQFENINLIHTRLSIQDVSHGQQPFHFGNFSVVFNGEIYNHLELRKNYLKEISFKTISDTETLVVLYSKYKEKMFDYLDGMFAFAILDKTKKEIILARDRSGKKPLYIYKDQERLLFASELNVLKETVSLEINEDNIKKYLRTGFFYKDDTPYQNVIELNASEYCIIDIRNLNIQRKHHFDILDYYKKKSGLSFNDSLNQVEEALHKGIKDRLLSSDLEVGAFLSGGIDSSLIVAIASQYKEKLKTFTVKFDGTFDESHLARLTAQKYGTEHHEISISMNLKNDVERILCNYGEPFMDSSAIPSYYVSQEAKKHVTVILNGDGADELFAGYRRYVPIANNWIKSVRHISSISNMMPKPNHKQSLYSYVFRLLKMSNKKGLDFYLSATNDIFEDEYSFQDRGLFLEMNDFISKIENEPISELSKMLYLDFNLILFSDLLIKMDIATMANSLEGRSPFLSKYMLQLAPTIEDKYKIKGKTTKYILRELSKKYVSSELVSQPKRGFEVPLKKWIESDLKENIFDTLNGSCYSEKFIDKKFITQLLNQKIDVSDEKRAKMLWTMYCLEVWKKNQ